MRLTIMLGIAVVCLALGAVELPRQARAELLRRGLLAEVPLSADRQAFDLALDAPRPLHEPRPYEGIEKVLVSGRLSNCPVTEATLNSITVFYKGRSGWIYYAEAGENIFEGNKRWESIPARYVRLRLSKALEGGKFGMGCFHTGDSYPITMVEVGDRVELRIVVEDDWYVCRGITIWRRPGGLVPKAPEDKGPEDAHHHYEGANALQDLEFKGVPLPRKYFFLKNNGTLPKHRQGIVAYPGVMPIIRPLANGTRRLFR